MARLWRALRNPQLGAACSSASGNATPGVRFRSFLDGFPARNRFTSICNADASDLLTPTAELLARLLSTPCPPGPLDLDPTTPDLEVDCRVEDFLYPGSDPQAVTPIPPCQAIAPPSPLPSSHVDVDRTLCPSAESGAALTIVRAQPPPAGSVLRFVCTNP